MSVASAGSAVIEVTVDMMDATARPVPPERRAQARPDQQGLRGLPTGHQGRQVQQVQSERRALPAQPERAPQGPPAQQDRQAPPA